MDNKKDFLQTIKDLFSKAVSKFRELRDMLEAKLGARRLRIIAVSVTAFIVLLILMIASGACSHKTEKSVKVTDSKASKAVSAEVSTKKEEDESSEAEESTAAAEADEIIPEKRDEHVGDLKGLKEQLKETTDGLYGNWSVFIKNLDTGDAFTLNDHPVYPASMIKLFCGGACYQAIEDGLINEEDYEYTIYTMVSESNNDSFNTMLWALGKGYVTNWCRENGYLNTEQHHGLFPSDNGDGLEDSDMRNQTCASDVGRMLEDIYNGECVSKEASEKMLDLLFRQKYRSKIPAGVPYGDVANKTGETYDVSHDCAIVYSPNCTYIVVIMCECPYMGMEKFYEFSMLSSQIYYYMNS